MPSFIAKRAALIPEAPLAPCGWPTIDLVALMGIRHACSLKQRLMALVSIRSLSSVEVP